MYAFSPSFSTAGLPDNFFQPTKNKKDASYIGVRICVHMPFTEYPIQQLDLCPALLPANFTCRFIFSTGGVYVVPANVTGASSFVVCNFTSILPTHNNATSMIVEVGYFGSGWQQVPTPYLFVSRPNITLLTPAFGPYHTILAGGALPVSSGAPSTMTTVVTEQSVSEPITSYVWATATGTGFFCCNMLAAILDIPTNKSLENYLGALVASSSSSTTCMPLTFPEAIDNKQLFSGSSQLLSWDLNPTRQRMIPTT